jgi:hypothetical protein
MYDENIKAPIVALTKYVMKSSGKPVIVSRKRIPTNANKIIEIKKNFDNNGLLKLTVTKVSPSREYISPVTSFIKLFLI